MKKLLLVIVVLIALGIWVMVSPPQDGGYLLIAFGQKTVEMSLMFAGLLILLTWFSIWFILRVLRGGWSFARNFSGYFAFGGPRAQQRTNSGLIDYIEGNWVQARKKLLRAAPKVESPVINYLFAARSAHTMGDRAEADKLLATATKVDPANDLAVALVQARMDLESGLYDQCLAALLRVKIRAPHNLVRLDLLRQVYVAREDWESLHEIFPQLRKATLGSQAELDALEIKIHSEILKKMGTETRRLFQPDRLPRLRAAWNKLPGYLQKDNALLVVYIRQLVLNAEDNEAEQIIRKALGRDWHSELVYWYGRVHGSDVGLQLRTAEYWLKQHPHDPALLLTLGRLCLRNQIWGSARDYFKESLRIKRSAEAYAELARLVDSMGEHERGADYYVQALNLNIEQLPDLPLPKGRG